MMGKRYHVAREMNKKRDFCEKVRQRGEKLTGPPSLSIPSHSIHPSIRPPFEGGFYVPTTTKKKGSPLPTHSHTHMTCIWHYTRLHRFVLSRLPMTRVLLKYL